jgi:hypothetical protein
MSPNPLPPGLSRLYMPCRRVAWAAAAAVLLAGCASRAVDVRPAPTNPAEFLAWSCARIDDETEVVQKRASDLAYAVDERTGQNILALGMGLSVFWPALVAIRPEGLEADDLARLRGRYEALLVAAGRKSCPAMTGDLPPDRAAVAPVVVGERLVYEQRAGTRQPPQEWALRLSGLRRNEVSYELPGQAGDTLRHDATGNVTSAPAGSLQWPMLIRGDLALGSLVSGDISVVGDPQARARIRGQVVAIGPQQLAGRNFDVAVIELYGDAPRGEAYTRVDGAMVVDRRYGVLLRLDLRSAQPAFRLQRRLVRIETTP